MKTFAVLFVSAVLLVAGIGCAALSHMVTPAAIDKAAVSYAAEAGVADANDFAGYANLEKAIRLEVAVKSAFEVKSLALAQMAEKNQLDFDLLHGITTNNAELARQREAQLFGETGLLSVGLSALGAGGFAGVLGLMRRRPGDLSPVEVEQAVASMTLDKDTVKRQMAEVVKGVQGYIDNLKGLTAEQIVAKYKDEDLTTVLKNFLSMTESSDTRQTVAAMKVAEV